MEYCSSFLVGTAPSFTRSLSDTDAIIPGTVKLSVDVDLGSPVAEVKWFKDWKELYQGERYNISSTKRRAEIEIKQPVVNDAGTYRCLLRNAVGEVECEAKLSIRCKFVKFCCFFLLPCGHNRNKVIWRVKDYSTELRAAEHC